MSFAIITLGFFACQTIFPSAADNAIVDYIHFNFGLTLTINLAILGNIVWFLVLLFTLRYFQTAVFVERQYAYLHQLEDKLNTVFGQEMITREGKSYLADYPWFSDWMWFLYTIAFPALLFFVSVMKIFSEWALTLRNGFSLGLGINSLLFLFLIISIGLYIAVVHFKDKYRDASVRRPTESGK